MGAALVLVATEHRHRWVARLPTDVAADVQDVRQRLVGLHELASVRLEMPPGPRRRARARGARSPVSWPQRDSADAPVWLQRQRQCRVYAGAVSFFADVGQLVTAVAVTLGLWWLVVEGVRFVQRRRTRD